MATSNRVLDAIGKRLFGIGKDPDQAFSLSRYTSDDKTREYLDTYEGVVFACITAIAEQVGMYQPKFYVGTGDQKNEVMNHPLSILLANPQPADMADGITQYDLFEATQSFMDLQGECFWYLPFGQTTKQPKEIHILRPDRMGVSVDDSGEVNGYYLRRTSGQEPIPFTIEEIMHFKRFNPKNPYRGMGIIQAGNDYIETEQASSRYTRNFFKNNAAVSGILSIQGEVSRNAFQKFARQFREKHVGVENAGKLAIIRESEANFTKIGLGLNELDMDNLRKMAKDDVFMMFRTPRGLFGLSDDTGLGRASVETLEYIFAKYTIEMKMRKLDSMVKRMCQKYYPDILVETVTHPSIIPEDKDYLLQERTAGVDKWITRNEARQAEGQPDLPGGDETYIGINMIPVADASSVEAAAATTTASAGKIIIRRKKKHSHQPVKKSDSPDITRKEHFRLKLEHNKLAYATKYKTAFNQQMDKQKAIVIENIGHMGKTIGDQLLNISEANGNIQNAMYPVLVEMALEQGALALLFAGDDELQFEITDALERALRTSTARMAGAFNQQTMDKLSASLAEGITNGESLSKLTARVEDIYSGVNGYRAERVARTESGYATGEATLDAYRQTGYVIGKEWYANPGACEFCASLDGTSIGLEDTFVTVGSSVDGVDGGSYDVTYDDVTSAELHPNCNCTIIPVRE